jgi:hypothetical protein
LNSEETRAKMSAAQKGRVVSEEHKAKISTANKGRVVSEAERAKRTAGIRAALDKKPLCRPLLYNSFAT